MSYLVHNYRLKNLTTMSADSGLKCQLSICHLNTNPSNDSRFYVSETYKSDKGRPKKIENHEIRRILAAVVWRAAETSLLDEGAGDGSFFYCGCITSSKAFSAA